MNRPDNKEDLVEGGERCAAVVRGLVAVGTAVGLLVCATHIWKAGGGSFFCPPQSDASLFLQYAQSIVEGHPYRFMAEDAPSTGSTGHLVPWALASMGFLFGTEALPALSFFLNVGYYLGFLIVFALNLNMLFPREPDLRGLALLLCVFTGQTLFHSLGQTDMGLFLLLTQGALFAALRSSFWGLAVALFLAALCRPEGMLLALIFIVGSLGMKTNPRRFFTAGCAGVIAGVGSLILNLLLTGDIQAQSLTHKGYLAQFGLPYALVPAFGDLATLVRELLFGLARNGREFTLFPVLGGGLVLLGIGYRLQSFRSQRSWVEAIFLVAALGSIGLVAVSGWQGFLYDRHLAWILPFFYVYAAAGVGAARCRLSDLPGLYWGLPLLLLGFAFMGGAFYLLQFGELCRQTGRRVEFAESVHTQLDPSIRLGNAGGSSPFAYFMSGRYIANVHGIASPRFHNRVSVRSWIEILKHEPEARFDAWLVRSEVARSAWFQPFAGPVMRGPAHPVVDDQTLLLVRARWESILSGIRPADPGVLAQLEGWTLQDAVDIGHPAQESRANYDIESRLPELIVPAFARTGRIGDVSISDVGRVVIGQDHLTLKTVPHRPARLVLRTLGEVRTRAVEGGSVYRQTRFAFGSPLRLQGLVEGRPVTPVTEVPVQPSADVFSEVILDFPAESIRSPQTRIGVNGDRIVLAYWLYQVPDSGN